MQTTQSMFRIKSKDTLCSLPMKTNPIIREITGIDATNPHIFHLFRNLLSITINLLITNFTCSSGLLGFTHRHCFYFMGGIPQPPTFFC